MASDRKSRIIQAAGAALVLLALAVTTIHGAAGATSDPATKLERHIARDQARLTAAMAEPAGSRRDRDIARRTAELAADQAELAALSTATATPTPIATSTSSPPPSSSSLPEFFGADFASDSAFCTFSHPVYSIANGVLTTRYPAGSTAQSAGAPYGGAQICLPLTSGPRKSVTLTYQLRIPVGFDFVKGGKLPGLYGGVEPFSGGKHNAAGWSARLMWRAGGAAEIYGYTAKTTGYGDDYGRGNFTWLADGQWHTVTETVTVNDAGQSNGAMTLAYDGVMRIAQTDIDITETGTLASGLFFSTFYGGHDPSWAPSTDQSLDFRAFAASA